MSSEDAKPEEVRPYFIPAGINFAELPTAVQLAFTEIVKPVYDAFVLAAEAPLARSAGVTLSFLLALEVLEQFELGRQLNLAGTSVAGDPTERATQINRYLRIVGSKQQSENFLLRLEVLRSKSGFYRSSPFAS